MSNADIIVEWDFSEIERELEKMGKDIDKLKANATKKAAEVVKAAVERNVGRSNINKPGYVHMQDDVKISALKEDEETGADVREVGGGKKTGYKWRFAEYGTSRWRGNQFMTKSVNETADEVKKIIEEEIKKEVGF
ncbi:HK97-gp10 family putative phage morphogenesis protein [Acinetobacter sp.]|uniref:HK97-gp10 family putative phage morphogenesis protein n=1 Tax=Acinetobacter sp. TaxID=472 RepID=UPI003CFC3ECF